MKCLEMMVQTHTRGARNYMNEINKAMTLELTHRFLIAHRRLRSIYNRHSKK
jgi:hypothetical protein